MSTQADPIVLSGLAMTTPAGIARELAHPSALRTTASRGVVTDIEAQADPAPAGPGRLADRPSAMATDTLEALLDNALETCPPARRGLVLGSGAAGIDQSMTVTTDSLTRTRPYNVSPALVPACVMNYASALCAIRFDLQGPNVTVTAGRVTGLSAITYARRLLRQDRADLVICGTYEDLNDRRVAIGNLAAANGSHGAPGEGCCVFLLEKKSQAARQERPVLAEILALEFGVVTSAGDEQVMLVDVVERALSRAGVNGGDVILAAASGDEQTALHASVPNAEWIVPAEVIGDTLGSAAAFQIAAAVLSRQAALGGIALVVAIDPDGQVGCAVLRLPVPRQPRQPQ
jgi:3-oxoacyl-[acyl-carrier-protein] synthase II